MHFYSENQRFPRKFLHDHHRKPELLPQKRKSSNNAEHSTMQAVHFFVIASLLVSLIFGSFECAQAIDCMTIPVRIPPRFGKRAERSHPCIRRFHQRSDRSFSDRLAAQIIMAEQRREDSKISEHPPRFRQQQQPRATSKNDMKQSESASWMIPIVIRDDDSSKQKLFYPFLSKLYFISKRNDY